MKMKRNLVLLVAVLLTAPAALTGINKTVVETNATTHDVSTAWTYDETNHWHACSAGDKHSEAKHSFGSYICCDSGESDEYHYRECKVCGYQEIKWHRYSFITDFCNGNCLNGYNLMYMCDDCSHVMYEQCNGGSHRERTDEEEDLIYDENGHWHTCEINGCEEKCSYEEHDLYTSYNDEGHYLACDWCNYHTEPVAHTKGTEVLDYYDDNYHYIKCSHDGCEYGFPVAHEFEYLSEYCNGDCTQTFYNVYKCKYCEATKDVLANKSSHDAEEEWHSDETGHWHSCACEDCDVKVEKEEHDFEVISADVCHPMYSEVSRCKICGYQKSQIKMGYSDHNYVRHQGYDATPEEDGMKTYYECSRCHKLFTKSVISGYTEVTREELIIKYVAPVSKNDTKKEININASYSVGAIGNGLFILAIVILTLALSKKNRKQ